MLKVGATALFVATDIIAVGIRGHGYDIEINGPNEVSIAGFENLPFAAFTFPPFTTIENPHQRRLGPIRRRHPFFGI